MEKIGYIQVSDRLAVLPVAAMGVSFATEVRRAIANWKPDCISVQLPRALDRPLRELTSRLPELHLLAWKRPGETGVRILSNDPCDPRIEAFRLGIEHGVAVELTDTLDAGSGQELPPLPDDFAVERLGAADYFSALINSDVNPTDRERIIASHIAACAERHARVLAVVSYSECGGMLRQLRRDEHVSRYFARDDETLLCRLFRVGEQHLSLVLGEMPWIAWSYEQFRQDSDVSVPFPLLDALGELLEKAAEQYAIEYDEDISLTDWRAIFQYGRNLALVRNALRPGLYELVMAAKGCVDDDYGAIVLERALTYPPNQDSSTEDIDRSRRQSQELYFDVGEGLERAECAYPRPPISTLEFRFRRKRPSQEEKAGWQRGFLRDFGRSMCSWPPEDERIEAFFDFLRKRAFASISAEHTLVEEFSSSMLDGVDYRETMRNWHKGSIYVRRERMPPGRVGPVVLVWRDFPAMAPGLWRTTFYAENQNESDISFYASPLGKEMVGPLICRTEYFGILSVYPARSIPELWAIPELYSWKTCARLLLASAILLSEERYVAWVAPSAPDRELVDFARSRGVGIIYLPLASFSKRTLKKIRQVHVLGSREARQWAADYIFE